MGLHFHCDRCKNYIGAQKPGTFRQPDYMLLFDTYRLHAYENLTGEMRKRVDLCESCIAYILEGELSP